MLTTVNYGFPVIIQVQPLVEVKNKHPMGRFVLSCFENPNQIGFGNLSLRNA